jgi:hypothetical protein
LCLCVRCIVERWQRLKTTSLRMAALRGGTGGARLNHCCQLPELSAAQFKRRDGKLQRESSGRLSKLHKFFFEAAQKGYISTAC